MDARRTRPRRAGLTSLHCVQADADEVFRRWLGGAADDPAAGCTADDYATHIRTEHSTFRRLFEPMLITAGFEIVTAEYHGACYGTHTCLKRP